MAAAAPEEGALLQALYGGLAPLCSGPRPEDLPTQAGMADFAQLTPRQRAATFLVIGLDYSFAAAGEVVGRGSEQIQLEVISAMFLLEHVAPFRRTCSGALARRTFRQPLRVPQAPGPIARSSQARAPVAHRLTTPVLT